VKTRFLPEWKAANPGRKLSIWSAASSTGQEAYSLCMLVREHFPDLQASVLGTDLSPTVVDRARKAVYSQLEVNRGLPAAYLMRYFVQKAGDWHLDDRIKSMATFREMNLAKPWRGLGPFDIIFLRNVMIYFGQETRREILRQVRSVLAPGGIFVVGSAEASVVTDLAFAPEAIGRATWFRVKG
jgi:chemotaxis protein methyltransferase CheR